MNTPVVCDNKDALIAYLYDECDEGQRAAMDAHLATCRACAEEVDGLRATRSALAAWAPPERTLGFQVVQNTLAVRGRRRWTATVPFWAQAAAAMLILSVGAAIANLQVRVGNDGLSVSTGWSRPAGQPPAGDSGARANAQTASPAAADAGSEPWRAELVALGRQLRQEVLDRQARPAPGASATPVRLTAADESRLMSRFEALINASEERQKQDLARRVLEVSNDVEMKRRADLRTIRAGFGQIEDRTGAEVMRNRQMLDYLIRTSGGQTPQIIK
jgi:anti-sigma factor RsiW